LFYYGQQEKIKETTFSGHHNKQQQTKKQRAEIKKETQHNMIVDMEQQD
jgi:hypothetical protein